MCVCVHLCAIVYIYKYASRIHAGREKRRELSCNANAFYACSGCKGCHYSLPDRPTRRWVMSHL